MDIDNTLSENSTVPCHSTDHERNLVVCDADLEDIIPEYLEGKQGDCVKLRELIQKEDFVEIRTISHGMKGSGGCYGFPVITEIGAAMEVAAKAGNLPGIIEQVESLETYIERLEVRYE